MTDTGAMQRIPLALDLFGEKVHAVDPSAWTNPTPCSEWDVRDVVNHMTSEHLWAAELLGGGTVAEVGDRYDGDVLGDDPVAAWDRAGSGSREAWQAARPGDLVNLSRGDTPVEHYATEMLVDLAVHGWDLARGAALDESQQRMDPDTVDYLLPFIRKHHRAYSGTAFFAAPVSTDSEDPQVELLGLLGRRADWA
ncbi:MAG TPA: TIGR03086 family metal-binding protein [Actinomycetales bacterium]|nr:TIGR03086 family metal-binding protein [Actinomycetales bacterium]